MISHHFCSYPVVPSSAHCCSSRHSCILGMFLDTYRPFADPERRCRQICACQQQSAACCGNSRYHAQLGFLFSRELNCDAIGHSVRQEIGGPVVEWVNCRELWRGSARNGARWPQIAKGMSKAGDSNVHSRTPPILTKTARGPMLPPQKPPHKLSKSPRPFFMVICMCSTGPACWALLMLFLSWGNTPSQKWCTARARAPRVVASVPLSMCAATSKRKKQQPSSSQQRRNNPSNQ